MSKQTAVEWFWNQLPNILPFSVDSATAIKLYDTLQQAKAMEREQIINFANDLLAQNNTDYIALPDLAEQYYNETYGKEAGHEYM